MLGLRRFTALVGLAVLCGCGSLDDSTVCTLQGTCGDGGTHADTAQQQDTTPPPDTRVCSPGDTKIIDCNTCVCNADGVYDCTGNGCPDTGPPPSKCPDKAAPGGDCTGDTHCIYTDPCSFGCDCVDDKWLCGSC